MPTPASSSISPVTSVPSRRSEMWEEPQTRVRSSASGQFAMEGRDKFISAKCLVPLDYLSIVVECRLGDGSVGVDGDQEDLEFGK